MNLEQIVQALNARFPALNARTPREFRIWSDFVEPKTFEKALRYACEELRFVKGKHLVGTDEGEYIGLSYIVSNEENALLVLRERVPKDNPVVRSQGELYPSMVLHEREMVDLFGVRVTGLPEGPSYPLPDCWPEGQYPLRKEWNPAFFNKETMAYEPPKEEAAHE
ncbi:MAG: NADH-quinone oxidoreductase subunit C [Clostridiaceae bacterium]|nr:NADH-quinone oxidoreductase subunit C [Feifaniaceae bacterium]